MSRTIDRTLAKRSDARRKLSVLGPDLFLSLYETYERLDKLTKGVVLDEKDTARVLLRQARNLLIGPQKRGTNAKNKKS